MPTEWNDPPAADAALAARVARLQQQRQPSPSPPGTPAPPRGRRHPAKSARYAAMGMSVLSAAGLTSLFVHESAGGATPTGTATIVTSGAAAPSGAASTPTTAASVTSAASGPTVVDGAAYSNRWGEVQVEATFGTDGSLVSVTPLQTPNDRGRSIEINDYAVPTLTDEAISAQSAQVDTVSGATYTSDGYRSSLQSAIDAARAAGLTSLS